MDAIENGTVNQLESILNRGVKVNFLDREGFSPLSVACLFERITMTKLLVRHGAEVNARDQDDSTALHSTVTESEDKAYKIVSFLLKKGAEVDPIDVRGWTPLMVAAANQDVRSVEALLEGGAGPDRKDKDGRTALDHLELWAEDHDADYSEIRSLLTGKTS
jgi:ankyrin repeat protein